MCNAVNSKIVWSSDIAQKKKVMKQVYKEWTNSGRSFTNTALLEEVKSTKRAYKKAIKEARANKKKQKCNKLEKVLHNGKSKDFWRMWNSYYKQKDVCSACIDGEVDDEKISNKFANVFKQCFMDSDNNNDLKKEFNKDFGALNDNNCKILSKLDDLVKAIARINPSKALDIRGLCLDHLKFVHPSVLMCILTLFNACLKFGYVPEGFSDGVVVPLVKNKSVSLSDISNYRPITIVCTISKVFHYCLNGIFESYFKPNELQLGFVKNGGAKKAIIMMKTVCDYFTDR